MKSYIGWKTWFSAGMIHSVVVAAALVNAIVAADFPNQKDYDGDGDGRLTQIEAEIYTLHVNDAAFAKLDEDKDGVIEQWELTKYATKANADAKVFLGNTRVVAEATAPTFGLDSSQPLEYDSVADLYDVGEPRGKYDPNWFRIRGRVADFSVPPKKDALENVNPAVFSWSRDFVQDGDVWAARGAIGGYWAAKDERSAVSLGADFDRLDSNLPGGVDVDTLVGRAMGHWMPKWGGDVPALDALEMRYGVDYGTNFSFDGGALGGALEIEPLWSLKAFKGVKSLLGNGGGRSAANSPSVSLRNFLRVEGGSTLQDFAAGAGSNDDYLRAGGELGVVFWPFGVSNPLSTYASYSYLAELAGEGEDFHSFKAGVEMRLDEEGHFALRLDYVDGVTPLLLQEEQSLLLSLSVRF